MGFEGKANDQFGQSCLDRRFGPFYGKRVPWKSNHEASLAFEVSSFI